MKIFGFITARVASSRLPKKMLLPIKGRKVIEHIIDRAKTAKGLDGIVLCTSVNPEDNPLVEIAKAENIPFFRGSLEDKIDRWHEAAKAFGADYIITIDADDLFFGPEMIEFAIKQIKENPADVITADHPDYVCGGFTHIISRKTLQKICETKDTIETEMTKPYITDTSKFKVDFLQVPEIFKIQGVRMTLDYPEDLEFFKKVFEEMKMEKNIKPLKEILEFLEKYPEIRGINIKKQGDFVANQKKLEKLKLKK